MCEIAMAQVYNNATSQIQCNCQNLLRIIKKNILHKYYYKEKYNDYKRKHKY